MELRLKLRPKWANSEVSALSHEVRFTLLADMPSVDAKVRTVPRTRHHRLDLV
jgi:hypothetical protein